MRGELKGYMVFEVSKGGVAVRQFDESIKLETWVPDEPDRFTIDMEFYAGPEGSEGADAFRVSCCSPSWLLGVNLGAPILCPAHTLIMQRYDGPALMQFLRDECRSADGNTWTAIALQLHRIGSWEFVFRAR